MSVVMLQKGYRTRDPFLRWLFWCADRAVRVHVAQVFEQEGDVLTASNTRNISRIFDKQTTLDATTFLNCCPLTGVSNLAVMALDELVKFADNPVNPLYSHNVVSMLVQVAVLSGANEKQEIRTLKTYLEHCLYEAESDMEGRKMDTVVCPFCTERFSLTHEEVM